jgi:NAD(P)H-flavin reductase
MADQPTTFKVKENKKETEKLRLISLNGEKVWSFIPGQVAVLSMEGLGESYFAIASAPEDTGAMDFLVQEKEGLAKALCGTKKGDSVQAKGPVGKGFPIDNYLGRNLLLAAVGSAIAPMRGVLRSVIARRADYGKVTILYGVRKPEEFAFLDEIGDWQKANVEVVQVVSRPEGTQWKGKTGHVQDHFKEILAKLERPVAMTCGMKGMQEECREVLAGIGVASEEILTNF